MKLFGVAIFFLVFFSAMIRPAYAGSSYVLPYPSNMPGNISYKIHRIYEVISRYWYFGDFGQFDYSLKMSDKYLVEAKTLFEYKQYLLGHEALKKSDEYFINILPNLVKAGKNGKNTFQKRTIFNEAVQKHIEILEEMLVNSPEIFVWQPEKALPTTLNIKKTIENAINVRKK